MSGRLDRDCGIRKNQRKKIKEKRIIIIPDRGRWDYERTRENFSQLKLLDEKVQKIVDDIKEKKKWDIDELLILFYF
jgi:hypothetical protein